MKKVVALATAAVAAALFASTAAAGMTLRVGQPQLQSRVLVTVPLAVSCSPFDPSLTLFSEGYGVSIEQAAGTAIARGSGWSYTSLPTPLPFGCDGLEHTVYANVMADPSGPPFHGGQAVFTAYASSSAGIPNPWWPGNYDTVQSQSASFGPATLTMH
jgi:hypothetical protein